MEWQGGGGAPPRLLAAIPLMCKPAPLTAQRCCHHMPPPTPDMLWPRHHFAASVLPHSAAAAAAAGMAHRRATAVLRRLDAVGPAAATDRKLGQKVHAAYHALHAALLPVHRALPGHRRHTGVAAVQWSHWSDAARHHALLHRLHHATRHHAAGWRRQPPAAPPSAATLLAAHDSRHNHAHRHTHNRRPAASTAATAAAGGHAALSAEDGSSSGSGGNALEVVLLWTEDVVPSGGALTAVGPNDIPPPTHPPSLSVDVLWLWVGAWLVADAARANSMDLMLATDVSATVLRLALGVARRAAATRTRLLGGDVDVDGDGADGADGADGGADTLNNIEAAGRDALPPGAAAPGATPADAAPGGLAAATWQALASSLAHWRWGWHTTEWQALRPEALWSVEPAQSTPAPRGTKRSRHSRGRRGDGDGGDDGGAAAGADVSLPAVVQDGAAAAAVHHAGGVAWADGLGQGSTPARALAALEAVARAVAGAAAAALRANGSEEDVNAETLARGLLPGHLVLRATMTLPAGSGSAEAALEAALAGEAARAAAGSSAAGAADPAGASRLAGIVPLTRQSLVRLSTTQDGGRNRDPLSHLPLPRRLAARLQAGLRFTASQQQLAEAAYERGEAPPSSLHLEALEAERRGERTREEQTNFELVLATVRAEEAAARAVMLGVRADAWSDSSDEDDGEDDDGDDGDGPGPAPNMEAPPGTALTALTPHPLPLSDPLPPPLTLADALVTPPTDAPVVPRRLTRLPAVAVPPELEEAAQLAKDAEGHLLTVLPARQLTPLPRAADGGGGAPVLAVDGNGSTTASLPQILTALALAARLDAQAEAHTPGSFDSAWLTPTLDSTLLRGAHGWLHDIQGEVREGALVAAGVLHSTAAQQGVAPAISGAANGMLQLLLRVTAVAVAGPPVRPVLLLQPPLLKQLGTGWRDTWMQVYLLSAAGADLLASSDDVPPEGAEAAADLLWRRMLLRCLLPLAMAHGPDTELRLPPFMVLRGPEGTVQRQWWHRWWTRLLPCLRPTAPTAPTAPAAPAALHMPPLTCRLGAALAGLSRAVLGEAAVEAAAREVTVVTAVAAAEGQLLPQLRSGYRDDVLHAALRLLLTTRGNRSLLEVQLPMAVGAVSSARLALLAALQRSHPAALPPLLRQRALNGGSRLLDATRLTLAVLEQPPSIMALVRAAQDAHATPETLAALAAQVDVPLRPLPDDLLPPHELVDMKRGQALQRLAEAGWPCTDVWVVPHGSQLSWPPHFLPWRAALAQSVGESLTPLDHHMRGRFQQGAVQWHQHTFRRRMLEVARASQLRLPPSEVTLVFRRRPADMAALRRQAPPPPAPITVNQLLLLAGVGRFPVEVRVGPLREGRSPTAVVLKAMGVPGPAGRLHATTSRPATPTADPHAYLHGRLPWAKVRHVLRAWQVDRAANQLRLIWRYHSQGEGEGDVAAAAPIGAAAAAAASLLPARRMTRAARRRMNG